MIAIAANTNATVNENISITISESSSKTKIDNFASSGDCCHNIGGTY